MNEVIDKRIRYLRGHLAKELNKVEILQKSDKIFELKLRINELILIKYKIESHESRNNLKSLHRKKQR